MQELGDDYYKLFENNDSKAEDEEQSIRRVESRKKRKSQIGILQSNSSNPQAIAETDLSIELEERGQQSNSPTALEETSEVDMVQKSSS